MLSTFQLKKGVDDRVADGKRAHRSRLQGASFGEQSIPTEILPAYPGHRTTFDLGREKNVLPFEVPEDSILQIGFNIEHLPGAVGKGDFKCVVFSRCNRNDFWSHDWTYLRGSILKSCSPFKASSQSAKRSSLWISIQACTSRTLLYLKSNLIRPPQRVRPRFFPGWDMHFSPGISGPGV